jgi:hypothetical protein
VVLFPCCFGHFGFQNAPDAASMASLERTSNPAMQCE